VVWRDILGSVNLIPMLHFQPSPFYAPCFGYEPKARIVTIGGVDKVHISLYIVSPNVAHSILSSNKDCALSTFCY
jgi:hypothetical protein